jgi:uncharacterized protein (TIGR02246 family)
MAALLSVATACAPAKPRATPDTTGAHAGLDSLNARLSDAYRRRDPAAYAALYTDTGVFEWPAIEPVRGPNALAEMVRGIWAAEQDVELRLEVAARRFASDHATELGAFEQTWTDSAGVRRTEFGRYATVFARQNDGSWRMDRFLGFEDSTRVDARP